MFYCPYKHITYDFFSIGLVASGQVYKEEDTSKIPLELASALRIEREPVDDPEIRIQTLESIYLITLQVR